MSATATNKQPLLIDRPLLASVSLVTTATGPGTPVDPSNSTGAMLLVDSVDRDGALIESIELLQRVADDEATVYLYLGTSAIQLGLNARLIGSCTVPADQPVGSRIAFRMPKVLAPVPHAGYAVTGDFAPPQPVPSDDPDAPAPEPVEMPPLQSMLPQFEGLRIPRGAALWAAINAETPSLSAPNIIVQGGWY